MHATPERATRITADNLQVGDRVEARGTKPADKPNVLVARSVVLMSARDLAQTHEAQAAYGCHCKDPERHSGPKQEEIAHANSLWT